jgi:tetratricopeptide (TPR) repeat protein
MQSDGTLHEEDSFQRFFPVRDDADSFAGIADVGYIMDAALAAAGRDEGKFAGRLLRGVEGSLGEEETLPYEVVKVAVDLFGGGGATAEKAVRQLSERYSPVEVRRWVTRIGYRLLRGDMGERALELLGFNTRMFPESWDTWYHLGEAHRNLGHKEEALKAYQKVLELDSGNKAAEKMIELLKKEKWPENQALSLDDLRSSS